MEEINIDPIVSQTKSRSVSKMSAFGLETECQAFLDTFIVSDQHEIAREKLDDLMFRYMEYVTMQNLKLIKAQSKQKNRSDDEKACLGIKPDGSNCMKASNNKYNGYCHLHKAQSGSEYSLPKQKQSIQSNQTKQNKKQKLSKKADKHPCNGRTKDHSHCKFTTNYQPEGSQYYYCFKHKDNWYQFENADSRLEKDSDDDKELDVPSLDLMEENETSTIDIVGARVVPPPQYPEYKRQVKESENEPRSEPRNESDNELGTEPEKKQEGKTRNRVTRRRVPTMITGRKNTVHPPSVTLTDSPTENESVEIPVNMNEEENGSVEISDNDDE